MPAIALPFRATNCSPPSWQSARGDQCSLCPSRNVFQHLQSLWKRWGRVALRSTAVGVAVLACPDLLPSAWPLLDLGCLRPDGLPQTLMLFVNIGVPVVARWNGVPTDDDFDAGDIANRHRPTIEMDGNLAVWLEDEVVGLTRCNVFEVLRFRRRSPEGVDKLEVVGMQLLGDDHVRLD